MVSIVTEIEINTSPEVVTAIFLDFKLHPQWDPFLTLIVPNEDEIKPGTVLDITLQIKGEAARKMQPTVLVNSPEEFKWRGVLGLQSIFCGEHYFQFQKLANGNTKLVQGENFSGVLVPVVSWFGIFTKTENGFKELNNALKKEAESRK